jgi:DNA polymerase III delta subunit
VADALVAGDRASAVRAYLALREQGERLPGLLYWISQRVRIAHEVAAALDGGEPASGIKRRLRMPSRAADRLIADAQRSGVDRLRQAIMEIADLELASRGGGRGGAAEDTAALTAISRIAA